MTDKAKPGLEPRREDVGGPSPAKAPLVSNKPAPPTSPATSVPAKADTPKPTSSETATKAKPETKPEKKEEDNKIDIMKETAGLGFNITGGSDTTLGGVVVQEVHAGGPADKGGRLRPGDIILKVN